MFSRASRFRLLKFIHTVDTEKYPDALFVTLTYPDEFINRSKRQIVQDKQIWLRKLEQFAGGPVCGLWRIEWIERKSGHHVGHHFPHYHFLLFDIGFIPYTEVNAWWKEAIGHVGYIRTEVKRLTGTDGAALYVSKYVAKREQSPSLVIPAYLGAIGRHYGYHRKRRIKLQKVDEYPEPDPEAVAMIVEAARVAFRDKKVCSGESFTLIGNTAKEVGEYLRKNLVDKRTGVS
jgi:hypothetical protein